MKSDPLFFNCNQNPGELDDWLSHLNPNSKIVVPAAYAVSSLRNAAVGDRFQFERLGIFYNPIIKIIEYRNIPSLSSELRALYSTYR